MVSSRSPRASSGTASLSDSGGLVSVPRPCQHRPEPRQQHRASTVRPFDATDPKPVVPSVVEAAPDLDRLADGQGDVALRRRSVDHHRGLLGSVSSAPSRRVRWRATARRNLDTPFTPGSLGRFVGSPFGSPPCRRKMAQRCGAEWKT